MSSFAVFLLNKLKSNCIMSIERFAQPSCSPNIATSRYLWKNYKKCGSCNVFLRTPIRLSADRGVVLSLKLGPKDDIQ